MTRGYITAYLVILMLFTSTSLSFITRIYLKHVNYQHSYVNFTAAYAAALTGLRLSPQHISSLPTHKRNPTLSTLQSSPLHTTANIHYHYYKTPTHIYAYATHQTTHCILKARYTFNKKKVVLSEPDYYYES